jgi:nicotinate-nucleotide pyrophosphorylase (carboxylating)
LRTKCLLYMDTIEFIKAALSEDVGDGDHSTLACIPANASGKAVLKVKEDGVIAGMTIAEDIFRYLEPSCQFTPFVKDGDTVTYGTIAFEVSASVHTILKAERLALNCMQRMSGIATLTRQYVNAVKGYHTRILDTRKTTPLFRACEKKAVVIGGGVNLRMGLYDMVMLKDNHIDFCGGIEKALRSTHEYLTANNLNLDVEVETRNIDDVHRVLATGLVRRIMLDNFTPDQVKEAVSLINGRYETEASGGINLDNIVAYASTGVDFVSIGAITHHAVSMDLSLKAQIL